MSNYCGVIMAGGNGTRLFPLTRAINKHLLPVYDKPMIFYPLSTLMIAGIRRIAIVTRSQDRLIYEELLGNGENLGITLDYLTQDQAKGIPDGYIVAADFIAGDGVAMILGDNILLGQGLGQTLAQATNLNGAQIFAFPVTNPHDYGVVKIDSKTGAVMDIVEKPKDFISNLAIPGLYFTDNRAVEFAREIKTSARGELEITDILRRYLDEGSLRVTSFRRGIGWMDAGSIDSLYAASELVQVLQKRQGLSFASPEEIAWRNRWISDSDLSKAATRYSGTTYGKYLEKLLHSN
jgi:glucose-1-phosphate thymidylyltransferase